MRFSLFPYIRTMCNLRIPALQDFVDLPTGRSSVGVGLTISAGLVSLVGWVMGDGYCILLCEAIFGDPFD